MRILLAGGTGLVGGHVLEGLLAHGHAVVALGRRPVAMEHPGLVNLATDFVDIPSTGTADAAICALGTTMAQAGSREAFVAVDKHAVLAFARAAKAVECRQFIAVTAVGASPSASAFYSRVKGEVEVALRGIGFHRLDLVRPGLIIGARTERRPVEAFFQRIAPLLTPLMPASLDRYGAIPAEQIAAAIVRLVGERGHGVHIHENRALTATGPN